MTEQLKAQLERLGEPQKQQMWGLSHGDYNQHNVLYSQGEWALLNFEKMSYDILVQDLANFMRKILEKYNWNTGLGIEMITTYDSIRKLLPEELEQLYLRLAYPKKYWKIANHYCSSRKSWISGRDIEKLEKEFAGNGTGTAERTIFKTTVSFHKLKKVCYNALDRLKWSDGEKYENTKE